ncbi:MAG: cell division/cell wall cluster transcriptional repressor MraZ [Eubacterium sp.]|nr:cell division/cell wall cluster transcriptional repressor MraZ [Eubacterium sp.]
MVTYDSFVGHKVHKLDSKNRLSIPSYMRAELGNSFCITHGNTDDRLVIRTPENWKLFMEQLQTLPSSVREMADIRFIAFAEWLSLDPNGRILLADKLKDVIGVKANDEVVVFGVSDRIEIWNKSAFEASVKESDKIDWTSVFDSHGM